MKYKTIINLSEIKNIYKEYCRCNGIEFSEEKFQEFLEFLELDFYDWVNENIRYFEK